MSDVTSMFITYLLELYTWSNDSYSRGVVRDLWPNAKRAARWHINISSANDYLPTCLVGTYDILDLDQYKFAIYNSAFHLLAMKASETLAYMMGQCACICVMVGVGVEGWVGEVYCCSQFHHDVSDCCSKHQVSLSSIITCCISACVLCAAIIAYVELQRLHCLHVSYTGTLLYERRATIISCRNNTYGLTIQNT